jgi:hypothetical protein
MNSIPRAILATAVVVMFMAGMMVVPSYAGLNYNASKSNTGNITVQENTSLTGNSTKGTVDVTISGPACKIVKNIIHSANYAANVTAKVMKDLNCG